MTVRTLQQCFVCFCSAYTEVSVRLLRGGRLNIELTSIV